MSSHPCAEVPRANRIVIGAFLFWFSAIVVFLLGPHLPGEAAPVGPPARTADGSLAWRIHTHTSSPLIEGMVHDTSVGPGFHVERTGPLDQPVVIGWRVIPAGRNPVSADDFEGGRWPEGRFVLLTGEVASETIRFENPGTPAWLSWLAHDGFFGLREDGLAEAGEQFSIQLIDPSSGVEIPAAFATSLWFEVSDRGKAEWRP